jgi:hypothetical protein
LISNYQTKLGPSFLVFQFRPLALAASRELWFAVNQWRGLVIQAATEDEMQAECERSARALGASGNAGRALGTPKHEEAELMTESATVTVPSAAPMSLGELRRAGLGFIRRDPRVAARTQNALQTFQRARADLHDAGAVAGKRD